ncbi:MAG: cytochrome-c peroxidase [Pseudomonadales bacterium]|jgi:cytochrome c peroxidase|nr:cytochrome-c peroxidase [Pseudomonadales bacterium]
MIALRTLAATLLVSSTGAFAQPLPDTVPAPVDNPTTAEKVALGRTLYFDPRLSSNGTVSCNSCHNVMANGSDNRAVSAGVEGQLGGRNAPTVWNAAFKPTQFWDGRALTLEEQAKGPFLNPIEMGMPGPDAVVATLEAIPGYAPLFEAAFGPDAITFDNVARAIAAFERTLVTRDAPYDRYLAGDSGAMSPAATRGMQTFTELGCNACHSGPAFAGPTPMGVAFLQKFPTFDSSPYVERYGFLDDAGKRASTGAEADAHLYQVPALRNVAHTAPYMHNGAVETLEEAVRVMGSTQLNRELTEAQVADLVAFLEALTGEYPSVAMPRLPETPRGTVIAELR